MQPPEMTPQQALDALRQLTDRIPLDWPNQQVRLRAFEVLAAAVAAAEPNDAAKDAPTE